MRIKQETLFNPDQLSNTLIGIKAQLSHHDSGSHLHKKGQLLFCYQGAMNITFTHQICLLPALRIAWIPPRTLHQVTLTNVVQYRSIYLDLTLSNRLPKEVKILQTNGILRSLLEEIARQPFDINWQIGKFFHQAELLIYELLEAKEELLSLPFPHDYRLLSLKNYATPPMLQQLTKQVGASEKTISRIFKKETGLSYQEWRQQWRLLKAITLLSGYDNLNLIANELAFTSDSSFIAFFKKMTGKTPREYCITCNLVPTP